MKKEAIPDEIDNIIWQLLRADSSCGKKSNKVSAKIGLTFAEPVEEVLDYIEALNFLKESKIIVNYKRISNEKILIYDDDRGIEYDDQEFAMAKCEFFPNIIASYADKLWKRRRDILSKICGDYLSLIELLETYFDGKIEIDDKNKIELQKGYRKQADNIREKVEALKKPEKKLYSQLTPCYIPFSFLSSAQEVMIKNGIDFPVELARLNSYYGKLQRLRESFDTQMIANKPTNKKIQKIIETLKRGKEFDAKGKSKKKKREVIPLNLPSDTIWEDITVEIVNEHNVVIRLKKDFFERTSFVEMGFGKGKPGEKVPDEQWKFLERLSILPPGEAYTEKSAAIRKQKEHLSKQLYAYFQIDGDSFLDCNEAQGYKTRFKLTPEPVLRDDGELDNGISDEIHDYFKEQTPQI